LMVIITLSINPQICARMPINLAFRKPKHELEYRRNEEAEQDPVTGFINLGTFEIVRQLADDHPTSGSL
jgi:hypothetical protein